MKIQKYKTIKALVITTLTTLSISNASALSTEKKEIKKIISSSQNFYKRVMYRTNEDAVKYCKNKEISLTHLSLHEYNFNVKKLKFLHYIYKEQHSQKIINEVSKFTYLDKHSNLRICLTKQQQKKLGE